MKISITNLAIAAFVNILLSLNSFAQESVKTYVPNSYTAAAYAQLQQTYGQHKVIPALYKQQILIALSHFPELKETAINFRIKHKRIVLFTTPAVLSVFKNSFRRKYVITISDSTINKLNLLMLKRFSFNAQVGVLGHELSHIVHFNHESTWDLIGDGFHHISSKWVDRFEYRTDSICITHGLGYQLLEWSIAVRKAIHVKNYDGEENVGEPMMRERYMNPSTIQKSIANNPMYTTVSSGL